MDSVFDNELSRQVWRNKYRYGANGENAAGDTWRRVATAAASVEGGARQHWESEFLSILTDFAFLPAGRILAGAGTGYDRTLFNCFVMGLIDDSITGIFDRLSESAVTMQAGGGIGCDFSTLRPRGARARSGGTIASGPVSFMRLWDSMCATLLSTGSRRGAMMGTLRCDHPDIEEFVDAKRDASVLRNFNLSVQISDAFLEAIDTDAQWELKFPATADEEGGECRSAEWPGRDGAVACRVHRRVPARLLWQRILDAAYDVAEPGVLFVDRINRENNLHYCERITTANPCGEIPLPPYGACNLGSMNLTAFVDAPFSRRARLDLERLALAARIATRFLDDVIDLSNFPLPAQAVEARASRRIGLGITGLADALIMLGLGYDEEAGIQTAADALRAIRDNAYRASIDLAREKGSFERFDRDAHLSGDYVARLPDDVRDGISRHGVRNSHLIAIAPAGSISVLANNVSSGIEPVFALEMDRRVFDSGGRQATHRVEDFAYRQWRGLAKPGAGLPAAFRTAREISVESHLAMQAALQPLVDNAISKTVNVPSDISREDFRSVYREAYDLGLKGCTVFRPNPVTGAILSEHEPPSRAHCCGIEREGD